MYFLFCSTKRTMYESSTPPVLESIQNFDHGIQDHFVHYSSLICGWDFVQTRGESSLYFSFFWSIFLATRLEGGKSQCYPSTKKMTQRCVLSFLATLAANLPPQRPYDMHCQKDNTASPNKLYMLPSTTLFISPHHPGLHPIYAFSHTSLVSLARKGTVPDRS